MHLAKDALTAAALAEHTPVQACCRLVELSISMLPPRPARTDQSTLLIGYC